MRKMNRLKSSVSTERGSEVGPAVLDALLSNDTLVHIGQACKRLAIHCMQTFGIMQGPGHKRHVTVLLSMVIADPW